MERRGLAVFVSTFLLLAVAAALQFTGQYDVLATLQSEDMQTTVITGLAVVLIFVFWVLTMILVAKILYRLWKMIDSYLFRFWDLVVPESPIIRFGIILTLFIFLFAFGPLVVIQWVGMDNSSEDIENQVGLNESNGSADEADVENETTATMKQDIGRVTETRYLGADRSLFSIVNPVG